MSATGLTSGWRRWSRRPPGRARARLKGYLRGEAAEPVHLAPAAAPAVLAPPTHRYRDRPVAVASDLGSLRGPVTGTIRLPELLHWSGDESAATFNLEDPRQRPAVYVAVLREAREAAELEAWLNGRWLLELWPRLVLPKAVRAAWEKQHQVLFDAGKGHRLRAAR